MKVDFTFCSSWIIIWVHTDLKKRELAWLDVERETPKIETSKFYKPNQAWKYLYNFNLF